MKETQIKVKRKLQTSSQRDMNREKRKSANEMNIQEREKQK